MPGIAQQVLWSSSFNGSVKVESPEDFHLLSCAHARRTFWHGAYFVPRTLLNSGGPRLSAGCGTIVTGNGKDLTRATLPVFAPAELLAATLAVRT